mmetsp:Transcript_26678/g.64455  ORF Transcript_26678/g.64455 Transcript_26678/m.64455 type:complete len:294 (+) Transcript_26678:699-1580(+)
MVRRQLDTGGDPPLEVPAVIQRPKHSGAELHLLGHGAHPHLGPVGEGRTRHVPPQALIHLLPGVLGPPQALCQRRSHHRPHLRDVPQPREDPAPPAHCHLAGIRRVSRLGLPLHLPRQRRQGVPPHGRRVPLVRGGADHPRGRLWARGDAVHIRSVGLHRARHRGLDVFQSGLLGLALQPPLGARCPVPLPRRDHPPAAPQADLGRPEPPSRGPAEVRRPLGHPVQVGGQHGLHQPPRKGRQDGGPRQHKLLQAAQPPPRRQAPPGAARALRGRPHSRGHARRQPPLLGPRAP